MTHKKTDGGPFILDLAEHFEPIRATDDAGVAVAHGGHHTGVVAAMTTLTPPLGARRVQMQALTQNVRYTLDGTNPTAASGFQLKAGDAPRFIYLSHRTIVKVVAETAGAVLEFVYGV